MFKEGSFLCDLSLVCMCTCGAVAKVEVVGISSFSLVVLTYLSLTRTFFLIELCSSQLETLVFWFGKP